MKALFINNEYMGKKDECEICDIVQERGLNMEVSYSNGYSHDWIEIEPFDDSCFKSGHIYLTSKPVGRKMGSSIVSFS
jgi:hypothetical protein